MTDAFFFLCCCVLVCLFVCVLCVHAWVRVCVPERMCDNTLKDPSVTQEKKEEKKKK